MPNVGETVPDFELPNQDGTMVKLSDYRGKKVAIFAFPKAGTAGCTAQACSFRDAFPQIEAGNAVVLGISGDKLEDLKTWKQRNNLQYDLISDQGGEVLKTWSAWGKPIFGIISLPVATRSYWVIDEEGKLLDMEVGIGPEESVKKALEAINNAEVKA